MFFPVILSLIFLSICPLQGQETHLWQQIAPRLTKSHFSTGNITNAQTAFQLSAANALIKHGEELPPLSPENLQALDSLHLFEHIIPKITHTHLYHGYFTFAKNMCSVNHDLEKLKQQDTIISYLQSHPMLTKELSDLIKGLQEAETAFLSDFYPQGSDWLAKKMSGDDQSTNPIATWFSNLKNKIESNRFLAEYWQRSSHCASAMMWVLLAWTVYNIKSTVKAENVKQEMLSTDMLHNVSSLGLLDPKKIPKILEYSLPINRSLTKLSAVGACLLLAVQAANASVNTKHDFDNIYHKQVALMKLNTMFTTSQKISSLLSNHPELAALLPEVKTLDYFGQLKTSKKISDKQLKAFIALLNSSTFTGDPAYYISFQGKILETHTLFNKVKHHFVKLWQALGELDSHLCVQELLTQQHGRYCQPTWVDTRTPILHLKNYWHPAISYVKAVPNSMYLGTFAKIANPHNAIITGANAGGKTTALTAIMLAQLMAQSIGIAPAESLTATPFARFHTYLDITTNLEQNESLFMAQANRAEKLYKSITSCHNNEKSLTILDEIFTGTRADFASKASFEFAQRLGGMEHSACLLATHFPQLTELEKLHLFMNYQAANAAINADGTISYPYKIIPGISTQNIAEHILKQKGLLK